MLLPLKFSDSDFAQLHNHFSGPWQQLKNKKKQQLSLVSGGTHDVGFLPFSFYSVHYVLKAYSGYHP